MRRCAVSISLFINFFVRAYKFRVSGGSPKKDVGTSAYVLFCLSLHRIELPRGKAAIGLRMKEKRQRKALPQAKVQSLRRKNKKERAEKQGFSALKFINNYLALLTLSLSSQFASSAGASALGASALAGAAPAVAATGAGAFSPSFFFFFLSA